MDDNVVVTGFSDAVADTVEDAALVETMENGSIVVED